jgi:hypothetical protein
MNKTSAIHKVLLLSKFSLNKKQKPANAKTLAEHNYTHQEDDPIERKKEAV